MIDQSTEMSLGVFWNGEEVDGFTVYGLFRGSDGDTPILSRGIWRDKAEVKTSKLFGENWVVWVWDIRIIKWPEKADWLNVIKATLREMFIQGAVVSWAGFEGFFVEPPDLFDPQFMSEGIWAIYSEPEGFFCPAQIGKSMMTVDDRVLELMKNKVDIP